MADKIRVRLNDKIEKNGGAFVNPLNGQSISKQKYSPKDGDQRGIEVERDAFIEQRLASRELVEVKPNPQSKQK